MSGQGQADEQLGFAAARGPAVVQLIRWTQVRLRLRAR